MNKKSTLLLIALIVLTAMPVFSAGQQQGAAADTKPQNRDVLVVGMPSDPRSLDPHATNDQPSARVMRQIYEPLMHQNEQLEISNGLVSDVRVINPTTYEFTIPSNIRFHNGEILTANDVKFTFERMRQVNAPAAFLVAALDRVEVINPTTFRMILKYPFGPFLTHLAHPATAILNERAVREAGDNYGERPVGTGPFKFVEWRRGDSLLLDRFDEYHGGQAASRQVRFRFITEDASRTIALETGEVDIIYDVGPQDFNNLAAVPGVNAISSTGLTTFYMGFNVAKRPFDDVRVRRAINLALNVPQATQVAFRGHATPAKGPLAPTVMFANTDLPGYDYNPDEARRLLREAGFPNGFTTTMWTNDNPIRIMYAEIFQEQLANVGITASIEIMEFAPYLDRTARGEHDMFMLGWVAVTGDADYGMYSLFHSSQFGDAGNRTFWGHPEVDRLLDEARVSQDPEARRRAYYRAQEIVFEEAPWVFLAFRNDLAAHRTWNEGFVPHAAGHHQLFRVRNR